MLLQGQNGLIRKGKIGEGGQIEVKGDRLQQGFI